MDLRKLIDENVECVDTPNGKYLNREQVFESIKLVEEKLKSPKSKLNEQSTPLCECGRPLVNKLVCSDRNCQQTSW